MKNIILMGFKSSGKSTIGVALAAALNRLFVDTDTLVEQEHTRQSGEVRGFRQIYQHHGRDYFLALEKQVIDQLASLQNHVIAVGGGTFIHHPVPGAVRQTARLVYLDVPPEILLERIRAGGRPAFFKGADLRADFEQHYQARLPRYQALADETVPVGTTSVAEAVAHIKQRLNL